VNTDGMPAEQLDAIEQRANATPGPWALHDALDGDGYPGHLWVVETPDGTPGENAVVVSVGDKAVGEFIAAARQDVPALLTEVRRLTAALAIEQATNEDAHTTLASYRRYVPYLQQHTEKAQAEATALAADLATARARIAELELAGRCGHESPRGRRCDQPAGHAGDHQALGGSSVSYVWANS